MPIYLTICPDGVKAIAIESANKDEEAEDFFTWLIIEDYVRAMNAELIKEARETLELKIEDKKRAQAS